MSKVLHRSKVSRCQFRKLPNGAAFYWDSDSTGPFIKTGIRSILPTNASPTADPTGTLLTDTSRIARRVPKGMMNSQLAVT